MNTFPVAWIAASSLARRSFAIVLIALISIVGDGNSCGHARLVPEVRFEQPDGTVVELRGYGNDYQAVYETVDGYTVIFVAESRAYFYARLSESGDELVSSGIQVGQGDPRIAGLVPHLRIKPETARREYSRARQDWEEKVGLRERWNRLKASEGESAELRAMRIRPTIGTKVGLTLLIDFDGVPGRPARSNLVEFLNGDNYRANGNRGSVKSYFWEVSGGKLLYTNLVYGYLRIPASIRPRSYYDDLNQLTMGPTYELIQDAIRIWTNQPNFMEEIVPQLRALSIDDNGFVLAANILVAGNDSGVWLKGLWPHQSILSFVGLPLELWPGGLQINRYQMTMLYSGANLGIGIFCHESGHLVFDFPDIYDYDNESHGGAGTYCLMSHNFELNPQHPSAYLKLKAGWATVTDIAPGAPRTVTLPAPGTNGNHFLRYRREDFTLSPQSDYFLIENRHKSGRDSDLPGSGILVWHIDELGNNNNENLLPNSLHANFEVTLVQADGRWDLHRFLNTGDSSDPFYRGNRAAGYQNRFADDTLPSAHWWDGRRSGLELRDFSAPSNSMSFVAEVKQLRILRDPLSQVVNLGDDLFLSVQMATNQPFTYRWFKETDPLLGDERITGVDGPVLGVYGVTTSDAGAYTVIITDALGHSETSRVARVQVASLARLKSQDLGDARTMGGSTAILNNGFYISAAGSGLQGSADGCRFLAEKVSGDFDVKARIRELYAEDGHSWTVGGAGLMVRAGSQPGAAQAAVMIHPGLLDGTILRAVTRSNPFETATAIANVAGIPERDNWVRLKREGNLVSVYHSTNNNRWAWLETVSLPLDQEVEVGVVATSYNPLQRIVAAVELYSLATNLPSTFAAVTIKSSTQEGSGETATIQIVSSRDGPLEVPYSIANASGNGVLYETLSGQAHLAAGTNVVNIDVRPIDNATAASPHVLTLTVPNSGVIQSSASVLIFDNEERGYGLKRETYVAIPGTAVHDLTNHYRYPGSPVVSAVASFESPAPQDSGQVLSGYITPPTTGFYRFYIASVHASELWLSMDSDPENAVKIAEETSSNTRRNWPGYASKSHISTPIFLTQGRWYFVRAIHKGGLGTGVTSPYLGVAWQLPGAEPPAPGSPAIGGEYLSWTLPSTNTEQRGELRITRSPTGQLMLSVESATSFSLEASSDLVNWQVLSTHTGAETMDLSILDSLSKTMRTRFYRLSGQ